MHRLFCNSIAGYGSDEQKLKQHKTVLSIFDNLIADNITLLFPILFYITVTLPGHKSDTVTSQGRMPRRVIVQFPFRRLQKRRRAPYPCLSFHFLPSFRKGTNTSPNSFESRPGFCPLTNYVMTTEPTWLTNMVYAPLI
jgi:hypothetical protein